MAHSSNGPVSTLPGSLHRVPRGQCCDNHPRQPATRRVQGETDSFGCEYVDLCGECYARHQENVQARRDEPEHCDWCKTFATNVRNHRDFEEGSSGRVYRVCGACRKSESDRLCEEVEVDDFDFEYRRPRNRLHFA